MSDLVQRSAVRIRHELRGRSDGEQLQREAAERRAGRVLHRGVREPGIAKPFAQARLHQVRRRQRFGVRPSGAFGSRSPWGDGIILPKLGGGVRGVRQYGTVALHHSGIAWGTSRAVGAGAELVVGAGAPEASPVSAVGVREGGPASQPTWSASPAAMAVAIE